MRLGLFFSLVFVINYLLLIFFGQNFLTTTSKNRTMKPYFNLLLLTLSWFIAAIISFILLFFLLTKSYTESLAPLVFTIISLSTFTALYKNSLGGATNESSHYQIILVMINTIILSMLFLEPSLVASLGRLSVFIASVVAAMVGAMILNYHFMKHLEVVPLWKSWEGHPVQLLMTALMSLALIIFSRF